MEHLSFALGLLVYSVALVNLLVLFLLWKKNHDRGIFWTIVLILSFTLLQLGVLFFDYLRATRILSSSDSMGIRIISLCLDLISLSLVFTVPRFSWAMFSGESWRPLVNRTMILVLPLAGILHSWSYLYNPPRWPWTSNLIYGLLLFSLALTFLLVFRAIIRRKKKDNISKTWYHRIAVSMARIGFLFIPLFCLFDFFQSPTPWPSLNRWFEIFSAVPVFALIWNIKLIRGAIEAGALSKAISYPVEDVNQWLSSKELTPREQEVALMLIQGKNYAEICDQLCLSRATVKSHTNRIYRKTDMPNQVALMKMTRGAEG